MALRLYRTTRQLFRQVEQALAVLGVPARVGSPTAAGLIALYVTGLVLLDGRPSQTRISQTLPARCHDALNRLLRTMPLSTRALLGALLSVVQVLSRGLGTRGYLCVDEVVIEKAFAKKLPWAAWTYSFALKRKVYGCHVVLVSWTSDPTGTWRIPVAFRVWRPQRTCAPGRYQKKTQLVQTMLRDLVAAGCPAAYLVGDTAYTGGQLSKTAARLGLTWVGTLSPRTTALRVYAPALGQVRLVVLRNEHGNFEYLVTNDQATDLSRLVRRKWSRWRIETIFRDTKQSAGLAACQCWVDQALVRHVALVLVTFVVLQLLRCDPQQTVGAVKARWQGEILRDGQAPPAPLRATPPAFRRSRAPLRLTA
jgi:hypothetical protein